MLFFKTICIIYILLHCMLTISSQCFVLYFINKQIFKIVFIMQIDQLSQKLDVIYVD